MRAFCVFVATQIFSGFILKMVFKIPLKNLGGLTTTIFIFDIFLSFLMFQKTQYTENHNPKSQKKYEKIIRNYVGDKYSKSQRYKHTAD